LKRAFVAIAFLSSALAQNADSLIARNIAARGGRAKLESIKTRRVHARIESGGEKGTLSIEQKRPSKIRFEIAIGGETVVRGYDGAYAWEIDSHGAGSKLSPDETGNLAREAEFDGPLLDYRANGRRVEYAGRPAFQGRNVSKVMLRWKDGNVSYYYLDPDTGLETAEEIGRDLGGREVRFLSVFGDYRGVGGIKIAFSIDTRGEETGERQTVRVDSIELNPGIDDARFSLAGNRHEGAIAAKN
jgi:hypothetical protein